MIAFRNIALIVCFLAFLAFPLVNEQLGLVSDIRSFENRKPADKPRFDINLLDPFPALYDTFYNDNFNLRSTLIQLNSALKVRVFGTSPIPNRVIIGDDDWLFANTEEFRSFLGVDKLTKAELDALTEELEYRNEFLKQRGCKFYLAITPAKGSVYPEKIGLEYYRRSTETWGEQLVGHLQEHTTIRVIDLLGEIKSKKSLGDVYYRLDNHWNELGAFIACQAIIRKMREDLPTLEVPRLEDYTLTESITERGNMADMFGSFVTFRESAVHLEPKRGKKWEYVHPEDYPCIPGFAYCHEYQTVAEIAGSRQPRLLIISDSYGGWIYPILADHFSRTVKIFDAWQFKLNEPIVEAERPQALLLLMNEALIRNMLGFRSGPKKHN